VIPRNEANFSAPPEPVPATERSQLGRSGEEWLLPEQTQFRRPAARDPKLTERNQIAPQSSENKRTARGLPSCYTHSHYRTEPARDLPQVIEI